MSKLRVSANYLMVLPKEIPYANPEFTRLMFVEESNKAHCDIFFSGRSYRILDNVVKEAYMDDFLREGKQPNIYRIDDQSVAVLTTAELFLTNGKPVPISATHETHPAIRYREELRG